MPEVHLPHLDDHDEEDAPPPAGAAAPPAPHARRGRSIVKIVLEVVLIGTGVFLGLAGEQWRERAHNRELAAAALRRFHTEILANRKVVSGVKDYHVTLQKSLGAYLAADTKTRRNDDVKFEGLRPALFEHTAWDLALATQSLAHIDSDMAYELSRIYGAQQVYTELTRGIMQAMYLRTPGENLEAFARSVAMYYGDVVLIEPKLLQMYDDILPRLGRMLGESPAH